MSNHSRIRIPRTSDQDIINAFIELGDITNSRNINVSLIGNVPAGTINTAGDLPEHLKEILSKNLFLIDRVTSNCFSMTVTYHRGGERENNPLKSGAIDEIIFVNDGQGITPEQIANIVGFLGEKLKRISISPADSEVLESLAGEKIAIQSAILTRLQQLGEDLLEKGYKQNLEYKKELEIESDARITKRTEEVEAVGHRIKTELANQQDELDKIKQELSEKLKSIDDSSNTHARRQIRDNMLKDVEAQFAKFGVSEKTEQKRAPVQKGMFILMTVFFGILSLLIIGSAIQKSPDNDPLKSYIDIVRITLLSLGLIGSVLYYIKWANKWAEHHANLEFQLQQFKMDINRANWAIESSLEWQKNTASPMPTELITSITKGLFVTEKSEPERVIHPADELASALLGSASKLTLKSGENQFEFDKPGKIPN